MLKKTSAYSKEAVGLKILNDYLNRKSALYPDELKYREQIRDFILGICIMRSGGILKEIGNEFLPYDGDFCGSDIVVYSAGTFGQQLMRRIDENDYCNVVAWVDADYQEYRRCCLNVDPVESVDFIKFDYILVATVDGVMAEQIRDRLIWRGIPERKILTVRCPEEKRELLLKKYLNIEELK